MRLIECLDCQAENTLDSRFCRNCGGKLPEDALTEYKAENQKLIQDAKLLFGDYRFDECRMLVESVLEVEPGNVEATALLGDICEREGRIEDAIQLYEKVVEARPDSAIDRVRLTHLRKIASIEELKIEEAPSRRNALLAGTAGAVLLFSVGAALLLAMNPGGSSDEFTPTNELALNDSGAEAWRNVPQSGNSLVPPIPELDQNQNAQQATPTDTPVNQSQNFQLNTPHVGGSTRLSPITGQVSPYRPEDGLRPLDPGITVVPNHSGTNRPQNNDPDPQGVIDPSAGQSTNNGANNGGEVVDNSGIVEIKVRERSTASSNNDSASRSVDALITKARDLSAQGNHAEAVAAYEAALRAGASPGSTNQRIAQCYEKLGNRPAAIAAYKRAIQAYEATIQRNGGSAVVRTALAACQQALKNLGG